ncbi:hypothetical protein [Ureaplasma diversum]|uniref:Uncharacterized protein n=1 Tax=Ureaplasma diversum NCTC 246 TaxID=1188241 RepID=A0A084F1E2_9BACT|nr:hypothetical protein [Ureaplasma diversum]KEZ24034.1 Hypothetical protein, predicted transmembrane protein [Ureaplasma diversum NCTC 246]
MYYYFLILLLLPLGFSAIYLWAFYIINKHKKQYEQLRIICLKALIITRSDFNHYYYNTSNLFVSNPSYSNLINSYLEQISNNLNSFLANLRNYRLSIVRFNFKKIKTYHKLLVEQNNDLYQQINVLNDAIVLFWKDTLANDQNEQQLIDQIDQLNSHYAKLCNKYNIDCLRFYSVNDAFNQQLIDLRNQKNEQLWFKYSKTYVQLLYKISNLHWILNNLLNVIKQVQLIDNYNNASALNVEKKNFLTLSQIQQIKDAIADFALFKNNKFLTMINQSQFNDLNNELKQYLAKIIDLYKLSSQNAIGAQLFEQYKNVFKKDYGTLNYQLNKTKEFLLKLNSELNNFKFDQLLVKCEQIQTILDQLSSQIINQSEIVESIDFIFKTHQFYLDLSYFVNELNQLHYNLAEWLMIYNDLVDKIVELKNKKYQIEAYCNSNQREMINCRIDQNWLVEDFDFIEHLDQLIHFKKRIDFNEILDTKFNHRVCELINQRFSMIINLIHYQTHLYKRFYNELINALIIAGSDLDYIKNKYPINNWSELINVQATLVKMADDLFYDKSKKQQTKVFSSSN